MTATWQAAVLSGVSNLLAQLLTGWRKGAIAINLVDTFHFMLFATLSCPPNVVWQAWMEAQFPAYGERLPTGDKEALVDAHTTAMEKEDNAISKRRRTEATTKNSSSSKPGNSAKKLNLRNTAIKFLLDQTLGSVVNVRYVAKCHSTVELAADGMTELALHRRHWSDSRQNRNCHSNRRLRSVLSNDGCGAKAVASGESLELHADTSGVPHATRKCSWSVLGYLPEPCCWRRLDADKFAGTSLGQSSSLDLDRFSIFSFKRCIRATRH